jgi:NAD(P)-dependent dehydrogenase (short-subunit alcohol dehydrogenase family)
LNRWVLITGCSTGIGRALVGACRRRGWGVVATARKVEDLAGLPSGEDLRVLSLDVTDHRSIALVLAACGDLRLIAVVNNAGYGQIGPLELLREEELRRQFETNVIGLHAVTRAALPVLRENAAPGEGRIVHVASMLGRVNIPLAGAYNASKHATIALAETLRMELGPEIPVILVEPGAIRSEFRETMTKVWGDLPDRAAGTRYEAILGKYMAKRKQLSEDHAGDADACAEKIAKALSARRPPRRVLVGADSYWIGKLKALLPEAWWEAILRRTYGLK